MAVQVKPKLSVNVGDWVALTFHDRAHTIVGVVYANGLHEGTFSTKQLFTLPPTDTWNRGSKWYFPDSATWSEWQIIRKCKKGRRLNGGGGKGNGRGFGVIVAMRPYRDSTTEIWCKLRWIAPPHDWPDRYSLPPNGDIECT